MSVLATEEQALALQDVIGEAICGAPLDHEGPCRIAWGIYVESDLPRRKQKAISEELHRIETRDEQSTNRSLGIA